MVTRQVKYQLTKVRGLDPCISCFVFCAQNCFTDETSENYVFQHYPLWDIPCTLNSRESHIGIFLLISRFNLHAFPANAFCQNARGQHAMRTLCFDSFIASEILYKFVFECPISTIELQIFRQCVEVLQHFSPKFSCQEACFVCLFVLKQTAPKSEIVAKKTPFNPPSLNKIRNSSRAHIQQLDGQGLESRHLFRNTPNGRKFSIQPSLLDLDFPCVTGKKKKNTHRQISCRGRSRKCDKSSGRSQKQKNPVPSCATAVSGSNDHLTDEQTFHSLHFT